MLPFFCRWGKNPILEAKRFSTYYRIFSPSLLLNPPKQTPGHEFLTDFPCNPLGLFIFWLFVRKKIPWQIFKVSYPKLPTNIPKTEKNEKHGQSQRCDCFRKGSGIHPLGIF
jgi:hypothetical protein